MSDGRVLRVAGPADAPELARVHALAFPEYFLTHLGSRFLQRYYRAFLDPEHTSVLCEHGGRVLGFVVGTPDLPSFRRSLYRPNIVPFATIVAVKIVTDKVVRSNVLARLVHVPLAFKALFSRSRETPDPSGGTNESLSHLFSICVDPAAAGTGVATDIMNAYVAIERERGIDSVELSVFDDNARALRFYEREGWVRTRTEGSTLVYRLDLNG